MKRSRANFVTTATLVGLLVNGSFIAQTPPAVPGAREIPLVKLNIIITDGAHHSLDDIQRDDVRVFEDKIEQTVQLFEKDERPIDYGIVIDTSASLRDALGSGLEAARIITNSNRATDETFIECFASSDKIKKLQDFTSDKNLLLAALRSIRVETGQSAVLDALFVALEHTAKHAQKDRRKAIVFITDGEDRASSHGLGKVVDLLHETNIQVFIIGIVFMLEKEGGFVRSSPREKAEKLLATIAEESGGRLFLTKNLGELGKAIGEIVHDLRGQIMISYQPSGAKAGFRKVDVKLVKTPGREKWRVIAPPGYYLNAPASNSKN